MKKSRRRVKSEADGTVTLCSLRVKVTSARWAERFVKPLGEDDFAFEQSGVEGLSVREVSDVLRDGLNFLDWAERFAIEEDPQSKRAA